jgi:hypothetical protein
MQLIIPQKAIPARRNMTMIARLITHIDITRDIQRRSTIEVLCGVIIHVRYQAVDVEIRDVRAVPAPCDGCFERCAVLVHLIDRGHVFVHFPARGRQVAAVSRVVLCPRATALFGYGVLGQELQRGEIQQDEVAATVFVECVDGAVDAVEVIGECFAAYLGVGQEGVVAEVVGADPDCVDGIG